MPTYEYNNHAYSLYDLRRQFPHRSFPAAPTLDDITPLGVTTVPDPEPVRQFSKQIHQILAEDYHTKSFFCIWESKQRDTCTPRLYDLTFVIAS